MDKYQGEDLSLMAEPQWQLLTTSLKNNKELNKVKGLAECIFHQDPDICLLTEVGGLESLENFNTHFLNNEYFIYHHPSNSDRGIDLGILCKKSLKPITQFKFHKHKVFARGVMQCQLNLNNGSKYIFLLTHLKSKLNKLGDFEGRTQRQKEVSKIIDIYKKVSEDGKIPTFVSGDLNGIIFQSETEFELSQFATKCGLFDIFEHLNKTHFDRSSYVYYNDLGHANLMQLDYFLVPKQWKHFIDSSSQIIDFDGTERKTLVSSIKEKMRCPSDHYPVLINLNLS